MSNHIESAASVSFPSVLINRFWDKVKKTSHCWLWIGQSHGGYGRLDFRKNGVRTIFYAHRLSWEIHHGPIPPGIDVLHECDNPACQNPKHLFLGTQRDNNQDKIQKGRQARGEKFPFHKLTSESVVAIRSRYASGEITQQQLADEFGICISQINGVVRGIAWKHVTTV
jgi:hypothetical protein